MIVKQPIGSVKVGNLVSRLTVGKPVPKVVLDFWKKTGQLEELKKAGAISESARSEEQKKEKPVEKKESEKLDMFKE